MDTVTHVVLGAAIGEAVMGKQVGKKAMLWGAAAANAPDADAIANIWLTDIESLVVHRGLSHSLYLALLAGPILGWVLWMLYKGQGKLISWMVLVTLNAVIHDLLDTCTVYGTGLFTPFSQYRYSWDNIFVADPLYTLPLLATFIALLALPSPHPLRRAWNRFGIITSSAYMLFTFSNHHEAESALYNATKAQGIKMEEHFVAPTLLNNFLWNIVASDSLGYWVGYYSILDDDKTPELHYVPKNLELLGSWAYHRDIKTMMLFSKGFYCVTESEGKRWFNDLRFRPGGRMGGSHCNLCICF